MINSKRCNGEHLGHNHRRCNGRRGPSSFHMHDSELVFDKLNLKKGDVFLDLGCGAGDYSIEASKIIGNSGMVYALDIREESLNAFEEDIALKGLTNINLILSDIKGQLPLENQSVDVCFIATVLHIFNLAEDGEKIFKEVHRLLKPQGRVVIIECKKEDLSFGPPMNMRNSPEELEEIAMLCGFKKTEYFDLGYNYMVQFEVE